MTEAQRAADVACRALAHEQAKRQFEASLPHVTDSTSAFLQCDPPTASVTCTWPMLLHQGQ